MKSVSIFSTLNSTHARTPSTGSLPTYPWNKQDLGGSVAQRGFKLNDGVERRGSGGAGENKSTAEAPRASVLTYTL